MYLIWVILLGAVGVVDDVIDILADAVDCVDAIVDNVHYCVLNLLFISKPTKNEGYTIPKLPSVTKKLSCCLLLTVDFLMIL